MDSIEDTNTLMIDGMDDFCESMHTNISETIKMWGDVLVEGSEHGWCDKVNFTDRDIHYAAKILLAICENRAKRDGVEVNPDSDYLSVKEYIMSRFGVSFDWSPENEEV